MKRQTETRWDSTEQQVVQPPHLPGILTQHIAIYCLGKLKSFTILNWGHKRGWFPYKNPHFQRGRSEVVIIYPDYDHNQIPPGCCENRENLSSGPWDKFTLLLAIECALLASAWQVLPATEHGYSWEDSWRSMKHYQHLPAIVTIKCQQQMIKDKSSLEAPSRNLQPTVLVLYHTSHCCVKSKKQSGGGSIIGNVQAVIR